MKFIHAGDPIAKQRPRFAHGTVFDAQHKIKNKMKIDFLSQFQKQGCLKPLTGPIAAELDISFKIPKSWSKKRKKEVIGKYHTSTPDTDNIIKWYFDILNTIAYKDDSQISSIFAKKTYSAKPFVLITLYPLGDNMVTEHAISYKDKLSVEDLNYLIKKANRLGLSNRSIIRVYQEEDDEGIHVYFSVDSMKEALKHE